MTKNPSRALALLLAVLWLQPLPVRAEPIATLGTKYDSSVREIIRDVSTHEAFARLVAEQNKRSSDWSNDQILAFDKRWRAGDRELIDPVLANDLSQLLTKIVDTSEGLVTEIIVMDRVGANVAVSSVTTDYWQGDEKKWQKTYAVKARDVFVDRVEFDLSTQKFSQQLSQTIFLNEKAVGAITVGFDIRVRPKKKP